MRLRSVVPVLLLCAACGAATPEPTSPDRPRTPTGPIPPSILQANVLSGLPPAFDDACLLGMALVAVDDDRAGQRLDASLLALAARPQRTARDVKCTQTLAQARLLRLARLGRLDLAAELTRPEPDTRIVALLEVRRRRDRSLLPVVRPLVRDPQIEVSAAAIRVLVGMADTESIQTLQMLAIDPEVIQLHGLACRALWDMGIADACGGRSPDDEVGGVLQGSAEINPCAGAKRDLRSTDPAQVEAALRYFVSHFFSGMSADLDPVRVSCTNCPPPDTCVTPGRRLRRIARSGPSVAAALASAVLLLREQTPPAAATSPAAPPPPAPPPAATAPPAEAPSTELAPSN